jgi:hypothetical protein
MSVWDIQTNPSPAEFQRLVEKQIAVVRDYKQRYVIPSQWANNWQEYLFRKFKRYQRLVKESIGGEEAVSASLFRDCIASLAVDAINTWNLWGDTWNDESLERIEPFSLDTLARTLVTKNADYGNSSLQNGGLVGNVTRMSDKVSRILNLTKQFSLVKTESLQDTIADLVGYCVLGLILVDEFQKQSDTAAPFGYDSERD